MVGGAIHVQSFKYNYKSELRLIIQTSSPSDTSTTVTYSRTVLIKNYISLESQLSI